MVSLKPTQLTKLSIIQILFRKLFDSMRCLYQLKSGFFIFYLSCLNIPNLFQQSLRAKFLSNGLIFQPLIQREFNSEFHYKL